MSMLSGKAITVRHTQLWNKGLSFVHDFPFQNGQLFSNSPKVVWADCTLVAVKGYFSQASSTDVYFNIMRNMSYLFSGAARPMLAAGATWFEKTGLSISLNENDIIKFRDEVAAGGGGYGEILLEVE